MIQPSRPRRSSARTPLHGALLSQSLLCLAIYSASIVIVWPLVQLATDDDFAYARMALAFLRTGHFVFNGWETAMVGWQVVWGALFIRLFGDSYLSLRLSVIVLGALLTLLLHRVLLRAGVKGAPAVFGTLTVVLSPLFTPMVTSFMTDVPALLCIVVAVYGCQRALRARSDRAALAWLCGSAALNVLDGTVRQIVWLGALVIVPAGFWLLRRRPGFRTAGVLTWVLSVLSIIALMLWFSHQAYSLHERIIAGPVTPIIFWRMLRISVYSPLEIFCFALPVLVAWVFDLRQLRRRLKLQLVAACSIAAPLLLWAAHFNKIQGRLPPWSANVVSRYGILWSLPVIGTRPAQLPIALTSFIAIVLLLSLGGFLLWLVTELKHNSIDLYSRDPESDELSLHETFALLLPFTLAYLALLLPRACFPSDFSGVFDRYYLPLIAVAAILLLRLLRERTRDLPVACYVVLVAFSFFSIAATHDLFTTYRTLASIRAMMASQGISPAAISGPWEEDATNQIDAAGYLNDKRIETPRDAYRKPVHPPLKSCNYLLGDLVPALHFQYVLTVEKLECLVPSQFSDVTYTIWLPPYHRTIYIERNPTGH